MKARTLNLAFDNESTDKTVLVDWGTSKPAKIARGEVVYVNATFFVDGTIRPDFIGVTSISCSIYAVGEEAYVARVTALIADVDVITTTQWQGGSYNVQFEFTAEATDNLDPGPTGHDTYLMQCYAETSGGPVDFGQGLFLVYGSASIATSKNKAFDQIFLKDQDGDAYPVRVNTEDGKQIEIGDAI